MEIVFANKRTRDFFDGIEGEMRAVILRGLGYLSKFGHNLRMPLSRPLGNGLFELRITQLNHIRFLYTFHKGKIYLLHGFFKKTNRISDQDIKYARKQPILLK